MVHEKMYFRNCRLVPFDSMYKKLILMKFGMVTMCVMIVHSRYIF